LLSCRILCCFMVFEAGLKRFHRVSAGGGAPLVFFPSDRNLSLSNRDL